MRTFIAEWTIVIVFGICAVVAATGCSDREQPGEKETAPAASVRPAVSKEPEVPPQPVPVDITVEAPPEKMPQVRMTEADQATCHVAVGDTMPEGELPDTEGKAQPLEELYGESLTVVFFWTAGDSTFSKMASTAALEDLENDVFGPHSDEGVGVIAINENDPTEVVAGQVLEAGATFPSLSDPGGAYFAAVATERLPRIYLLDADGKILWFDMEYSETTRGKLKQAIHASK